MRPFVLAAEGTMQISGQQIVSEILETFWDDSSIEARSDSASSEKSLRVIDSQGCLL